MRAEGHGLELHVRSRGSGELLECRAADDVDTVWVVAPTMPQRRRRLNQSLPDERFSLINNRTPNGFEGFVGLPLGAGVEEVAGAGEGGTTVKGGQSRDRPIVSRFIAP